MRLRWSPVAFAALYCAGYVAAYVRNFALVLYYPVTGHWVLGPAPSLHESGPAITWYGLMGSAAVIATVGAGLVPERWITVGMRNWLWVWPYGAVAACLFMLRPYFL